MENKSAIKEVIVVLTEESQHKFRLSKNGEWAVYAHSKDGIKTTYFIRPESLQVGENVALISQESLERIEL